MTKRILVILILVLMSVNKSFAHGGNCACTAFRYAGIGGPIITLPAYTMKKGMKSISIGLNYLDSGRIDSAGTKNVLNSNAHADDNSGSISPSLALAYGVSDKFNVFASMPYRLSYGFREITDEGIEAQGDSIGFGDLNLLGQYKVYDSGSFQTAVLGGIKLPTGQTEIIADNQERFETKNQPGTGSFDPMFGVSLSKQYKNFGVDFSFIYKISTEGAQNTTVGDVANYGIAISKGINHDHTDPFHHHHDEKDHKKTTLQKIFPEHVLGQHLTWDLVLESITHWEEKPVIDGITNPNHGGTTMFLNPGIRMTLNDKIVSNLSIGLPVVEVLNGEQGGSNLQILFSMGANF
jgi:hypothetical protein